MFYLKLVGRAPLPLDRPYLTVGEGNSFDANLPGPSDRLAFTLFSGEERPRLLPGDVAVVCNGQRVQGQRDLYPGDRIEWGGHIALIVDPPLDPRAPKESVPLARSLGILKQLSEDLGSEGSLHRALEHALQALVELAEAEHGYILGETTKGGGWGCLATVGQAAEVKQLVSDTIVNEAIRKGTPVHLASVVGHPWAGKESILAARLFSAACLPLRFGERTFGCVYLFTRTPGKSVAKEGLDELSVLATQAALLIATRAELRRERSRHTPSTEGLLYGASSPMASVEKRMNKLAGSDLNVLVLGETGTGKELVARELHGKSHRDSGPFIAVNCGAIPPTLMESTLFGHVRGAFTGASRDQPGKIQQSQGGTLFLDEVGDLPLELQVKLLRAIQEKVIEPVGATQPVKVDFRVVAATHRNLEEEVAEGRFRQDLYYRLNGASLLVPPLRDRGGDVIRLSEHFLAEQDPELTLTEEARDKLVNHSWPGNVRELQQVVSRAAVLCEGTKVTEEDIELQARMPTPQGGSEWWLENDAGSLKEAQLAFSRAFVRRTLDEASGSRSEASSKLGISERTLYRILASDADGSPV